jgi:hypothetical protein
MLEYTGTRFSILVNRAWLSKLVVGFDIFYSIHQTMEKLKTEGLMGEE